MLEHPEIGWIERTGYPSWMQPGKEETDEQMDQDPDGLHHWLKPSAYPLGTENIYRLPTEICTRRMPPRLMLAKKILSTQ